MTVVGMAANPSGAHQTGTIGPATYLPNRPVAPMRPGVSAPDSSHRREVCAGTKTVLLRGTEPLSQGVSVLRFARSAGLNRGIAKRSLVRTYQSGAAMRPINFSPAESI